jgi:hypothetical protein
MATADLSLGMAEFHERGSLLIRGALAPREIDGLLGMLEQSFAEVPVADRGELETTIPGIVERHREFFELAVNEHVLELVAGILESDPHLIINYGHLKPPQTRAHTVPHSDVRHMKGVPHHQSLLMVKCMYALTRVDAGSGGVAVHPGSHRLSSREYPPRVTGPGEYVAMEPGDLFVFNANLLHTATDNVKDSPRISAWYTYAQPWMRVFPGFDYSPGFLAQLAACGLPQATSVFGLTDPYTTGAAVAYEPRRTLVPKGVPQ